MLLTKPAYKTRYKNIWLLRDGIDSKLRAKLNLPNVDEGIDLIAESYNGNYCLIQCKFKGANESPTRKDIATFLDLSRNHCKHITEQILVHTGTNGIKKTALLFKSGIKYPVAFETTKMEISMPPIVPSQVLFGETAEICLLPINEPTI